MDGKQKIQTVTSPGVDREESKRTCLAQAFTDYWSDYTPPSTACIGRQKTSFEGSKPAK
jgi:hypothetical protein